MSLASARDPRVLTTENILSGLMATGDAYVVILTVGRGSGKLRFKARRKVISPAVAALQGRRKVEASHGDCNLPKEHLIEKRLRGGACLRERRTANLHLDGPGGPPSSIIGIKRVIHALHHTSHRISRRNPQGSGSTGRRGR